MGRCLFVPTNVALSFSAIPRLGVYPPNQSSRSLPLSSIIKFRHGFQRVPYLNAQVTTRTLCTKAVISEQPYTKIGAKSTGPIPPSQLIQVVETAANTGAQVCSLCQLLCGFFCVVWVISDQCNGFDGL